MAPAEKSVGDPAVRPDDPAHSPSDTNDVVPQHSLPQNWSKTRRWLIVLAMSLTSLMVYVPWF